MIRSCLGALLLAFLWTSPALAQGPNEAGQPLPADFHGKVAYFGNHSGEVVSIHTIGGGPKKDCPRPDHLCPERIGGALEIELEFDGDIVKGKYRGTGGLRDSELIGRRVGSMCRLFDLSDGSVWYGRCDDTSFAGSVKSVPNSSVQITLSFEAVGTQVRDFSEWQRKRREAILRRRRFEMLKSQYNGSGPIEQRFAAGVELDSYGWQFDQMRSGSVHGITRVKRHGYVELYGEFALEGGQTGWARGRAEDDRITCVEFWDMPGDCRPLSIVPPAADPGPPTEGEDRQSSWLIRTPGAPVDAQPAQVAALANKTLSR